MPTRKSTKARHAAATAEAPDASLFFNRDDSWIRFNQRVLEEAQDTTNPLLERVKFLAITASNLDEFVEIRVAAFLQRIEDGYDEAKPTDEGGLRPQERLDQLTERLHAFVEDQYRCWNDQIIPALEQQNIRLLRWTQLSAEARAHAQRIFDTEVDPLLTPVTIDPSHPFPRVLNKALCIALLLKSKRKAAGSSVLGVVTVPRALPRLIPLPSPAGRYEFISLHELIEAQAEHMFRGYAILSQSAFRVTRNSNLYLQEEESRSLLESVREELHNRRKGDVVRLEIESSAAPEVIERLRENFELAPAQVFLTQGPVNLSRLMHLYSEIPLPALKFPPFTPREYRISKGSASIFDELRQRDILLHHPFDSYKLVEEFVEAGAGDPAVISMKQTLYRTSKDSPIFRALTHAGQSKEVTVVVELMARFDEDSNIRWARELEDAGVGVFHGIFGYKTHCKLSLLVRRDADGMMRRYAHLGTGNYNPVTARFYTDISLLTARPEITEMVHRVFHYLTAETEADTYAPLLVAPLTLWDGIVTLIERETANARAGRPAGIVAKMNGLLDRRVVEALYAASQAGVEIDLIVRGMCSLRPGVKGLSDRIRVRSIVGRFLEHSRIFHFVHGGQPVTLCGSADWMPRNLVERCEVVFPVEDPVLAARLRDEVLAAYLADNVKARLLQPDGSYIKATPGAHAPFDAQQSLMRLAEGHTIAIPARSASHAE
ncbi:MAG: polyphosphate kinase 1 [Acidobacteriota bacterium]|nr:polyphosphate kinase 1 [Acidobacteriota bacterium]